MKMIPPKNKLKVDVTQGNEDGEDDEDGEGDNEDEEDDKDGEGNNEDGKDLQVTLTPDISNDKPHRLVISLLAAIVTSRESMTASDAVLWLIETSWWLVANRPGAMERKVISRPRQR
ncbi:hypothetical protein HAX54_038156 [Datura stramonium]|uniref:Uncharacterized protein n=1 Tax=Datura stramonium TaxID=4076 RepID=A0ABS8VLS6_DATST|nr:hypothetical protein [Datura stramonium]